jgi:hypothetical protein
MVGVRPQSSRLDGPCEPDEVRPFRAGTLDEAFGVTRPKGKHTGKRATRERLRPRVVLCVLKLHEEMPLDEALFERVGAKLEISGSLARTIYYEPATGPWRKLLRNFEIS